MYRVDRLKLCEYYKNPIVQTCTDSFLLECRCRNLTPKTIEVYAERLRYLYEYLHLHKVKFTEICKFTLQDYILLVAGRASPDTVNGRLRVYRRFFNYLEEEELIEINPMKRIRLLKTEKKIKRVLKHDEIKKMLSSIDRTCFQGVRNHLMISIFWDCMLRKQELLNIRISDIDFESGIITVSGKGRKQRIVPMSPRTMKHLHLYLKRYKTKSEWVFCYSDGRQISERQCSYIVENIGKRVGLNVHPHLIRHSAATYYVSRGGNPAILQRLLGHSSLSITENYLHITDETIISERFGN